ncbi:hypothetical protein B0T18DRAFT_392955 [Schizothecium vesticola]|uniref:Uncharacterized protein n=1 Tax=Schizothecium vesticola TaxID=314040 RepID=A0AA40EIV1_9PEZI|nr:hypothetical protein B0T18DRAFT_392955 [Schizothecium vesticola]
MSSHSVSHSTLFPDSQAPPPSYSEAAVSPTITVQAPTIKCPTSPSSIGASRSLVTNLSTPDDPYAFLSTFDTVFVIDDSGSMAGHSWREGNSLSQYESLSVSKAAQPPSRRFCMPRSHVAARIARGEYSVAGDGSCRSSLDRVPDVGPPPPPDYMMDNTNNLYHSAWLEGGLPGATNTSRF